jgi:hypothetical protein
MITIENCRAGKIIDVDFHCLRKDGGLNATTWRCDWPLAVGDAVIAVDSLNGGSCVGTVREVGRKPAHGVADVVLDLDLATWAD